jgi:hypothetical protein
MNQPYIGIIISPSFYEKIVQGKKMELLAFYEEAGKMNHLTPCFFRFEDLEVGKNELSVLLKNKSGQYRKLFIPRPLIIHNRGYQCSRMAKDKIHKLQNEGIVIFNDWNRYMKYEIHELLKKNEKLLPHLPETLFLTNDNMTRMMQKYTELIIKPNAGSLGKRNMMAERKNQNEWVLHYPDGVELKEEYFASSQIPEILKDKMSKFIIQERIPLAEYKDCPFDIRVSVQKNGMGSWQITGMVGKVAKSGRFVTNVARGGSCYSLKEILGHFSQFDDMEIYKSIEVLSLNIAAQLEKQYPYLADIGLDIGITEDGFPMFIECNARDLRVSFRNANMLENWKASYTNPISYGRYLLQMKINSYKE